MSTNQQRREESLRALQKELKSRNRADKLRPLSVVFSTLAVLVLLVGGIWYATNQTGPSPDSTDNTAASASTTADAAAQGAALPTELTTALGETVTCTYDQSGTAAKEVALPNGENVPTSGTVSVTMHTSQGDIPMTLDRSKSPCTTNAIESLAKAGYYNDTVCHRLTTSGIFVLQCGDPSGTGSGGPGFSFADEYPENSVSDAEKSSSFTYPRGTLAMANSGANTNGSQFFMVYKDSPLTPAYNIFGSISEDGLSVIDTIAAAGVKDGASDGAPANEVRITSVDVADA